jgi:hypothetical protein
VLQKKRFMEKPVVDASGERPQNKGKFGEVV